MRAPATGPTCQRGVGLLELALILVLLGTAAAIALVWLRADAPRQAIDGEVEALRWADEALIAFAAAQGRLPCPATTPGGSESCGSSKGYLPAGTLRLTAAGFAPGAERLRYAAGGSGGAALAAVSLPNHYEPVGVDGATYDFNNVNELDFCSALQFARNAGAGSTSHAFVRDDGGPLAVAYAIASPGALDADGDGDPFDAANAGSSNEIVHPRVPVGVDYDDRTLARDFTTLQAALGCRQTQLSLDAMALSVGAAEEVADLKSGLVLTAGVLTAISAVKVAVSVLKIILAAVAMAGAIETLTAASAALSAAVGSCVIVVGCALIPSLTAAVVASIAAIAASAVAIAANAAAAALTATAFALTLSVAIEAGVSGDAGGSAPDYSEVATRVCDQVGVAQTRVDQATAELAEATTAAEQASSAMNSAWDSLVAHAQAITDAEREAYERDLDADPPPLQPAPPPVDRMPALNALRAAGEARQMAGLREDRAQADYEAAVKRVSDLNTALAENQAKLAATTDEGEIARLQSSIESIQQQIVSAEAAVAQTLQVLNAARAELATAEQALADARQAAIDLFPSGSARTTATERIDVFIDAQQVAIGAEAVRQAREAELDAARSALEQATAACAEARAIANGEAPPGQPEVGIWSGAEMILDQADQRGGVR